MQPLHGVARLRGQRHRVAPRGRGRSAAAGVRFDGCSLSRGQMLKRVEYTQRVTRCGLAVLFALALAQGASAQPSKLETAREAYWKLDYEGSKTLAEEVLATKGLGHAELVEASKLE